MVVLTPLLSHSIVGKKRTHVLRRSTSQSIVHVF